MPKRKSRVRDKGIESYEQKRDFSITPEPVAKSGSRREVERPVFVVHRHEARRLHYDLRLELDGVLKSWAVPKGFSYDPVVKRLAIRTEDHPLAYEDFSGVIPAGQYGAGTMTIWDRGTFEFLNADPRAGLEEGKVEIKLDGGRLRGEWHMVKLKHEKSQWLLFKARDQYARGKDEPSFGLDLSRNERRPFPSRVSLMRAKTVSQFEPDPDWLLELKLAGMRVPLDKQGQKVRFRSPQKTLLQRLPHLLRAAEKLKAENLLIDGVLVCLDGQQRPSEELLHDALRSGCPDDISYYAFDLLYYDAWDLRSFSLLERKAALASVLPGSGPLMFLDHERSRVRDFVDTVRQAGLPAVIAKRGSSTYTRGESESWLELDVTKISTEVAVRGVELGPESDKVRFTRRNKVLWPREGYTKGDLLDYYALVADVLLPYLHNRPLSLKRFPDGIEGESFFQKNTPSHAPDWMATFEVEPEHGKRTIRYALCNDRETLLYLANAASIELHPWAARVETLPNPDWAIIDLDAPDDTFTDVVKIARLFGKLLRGIGIEPVLKTSGNTGLHIYFGFEPCYSFEQVQMFCEALARIVTAQLPDIATVERMKERRDNRIYLDFLQNRRGQTVVAPYSLRPVAGARVSCPLDWDELEEEIHPSMFTLQTMPNRLQQKGDLFAPLLQQAYPLLPALDMLRDNFT